MDWSVLDTLCKVIYRCVISVTELLLDTKMLQSSLASSNALLLLWLCFITVEFVDSLVALVAMLLGLVGAPRFFLCLQVASSIAELHNGDPPLHFD